MAAVEEEVDAGGVHLVVLELLGPPGMVWYLLVLVEAGTEAEPEDCGRVDVQVWNPWDVVAGGDFGDGCVQILAVSARVVVAAFCYFFPVWPEEEGDDPPGDCCCCC